MVCNCAMLVMMGHMFLLSMFNPADAGTHCIEGSVRLAGGTPDKNGRVEVCYNGVWGTVCGDSWGIPDTFVVCKQLGLTDGGMTHCRVCLN